MCKLTCQNVWIHINSITSYNNIFTAQVQIIEMWGQLFYLFWYVIRVNKLLITHNIIT